MTSNILRFVLDNRLVEIDFTKTGFRPSTTVLNYLRSLSGHRGTKEGCAEGDCGACTVVLGEITETNRISYRSVDSCMLFLASIHGKQLITVENLAQQQGSKTILHPVQQVLVDFHSSQCGFCTPGIVMSLFAFYKSNLKASRENIVASLSGNLCRCTGYEPIIKAAEAVSLVRQIDHFDDNEEYIVGLLSKIKSKGEVLEIYAEKQTYLLPKTFEQAIEYRSKYPDAYVINGATDTAIRQNKKHEYLPQILDISAVTELKRIFQNTDGHYLGAGSSIESIKSYSEENIRALKPMLKVFASLQIRNVATIGGNLCTASPIGDLIPLMYALKAKFEISSKKETRWVDAEDFITGYRKNCLKPDELLKGILIPAIEDGTIIKSEKVSTRRDLDISTVSLAMRLKTDDKGIINQIILAYGGMAEVTKRAKKTEDFLVGKEWSSKNLNAARMIIINDFTPITDARASEVYRKTVAGNLLLKMIAD